MANDNGQVYGSGFGSFEIYFRSIEARHKISSVSNANPRNTDAGPLNDCDPATPDSQMFDMDRIRDPSTAQCSFTNQRQVLVNLSLIDLWDVSYISFEYVDGELSPILIRGYAAKPADLDTNMPGIIHAHGLGGFAKESNATEPAELLGMAVLAYTGPGGEPPAGQDGAASEGLPAGHESFYRLFDTVTDPRGTWFWGHAAAAMRGLTCLETLAPVVDPTRLGITGFSAGGVISLIAAGVDHRVTAAVPQSGTGAWEVATESPNAWQHGLLQTAGLTTASAEWQRLIDLLITPQVMVGGTPAARIFMVNGTADEFFPLTAHMATYAAVPTERRMSLAGNFDHGCFQISGIEDPNEVEARASLRAKGAQRIWFRHWFGTDSVYSYVPQPPNVPALTASNDSNECFAYCGIAAPCLYVAAAADPGGANLEIEEVSFWWSNDYGLFWASSSLEYSSGLNAWWGCFNIPYDEDQTTYYLDVQYATPVIVRLPQERFSLSSEVTIPSGLVPAIRHSDCTLP